MKQYYADKKLKRKIQRTQYKKHPKWHKRKWVRRILFLFGIGCGIYGITSIPGDDLFETIVLSCLGMFFFGLIPYLAYRKMLETSCACVTYYREHDTVIITEEDMKYIYHPSNRDNIKLMHQFEIKFNDITKLIYNKYHNRIDVYGAKKAIYYSDFAKGEIGRSEIINEPDTRIRLYLYFEGSEEIIETLQEKSPVEIEVIDCPAE